MRKKVVLITGTNSGFGWLTANSIAALGHKVYATMRETKGKNAEKAKALGQVENVTVLDVTLTDEVSVQKAIDGILNNEGRIDVLVNNAGYGAMGIAETYTTKDVQDLFDIHVIANWRLMKLVLPHMRKQGDGLIVNVSSGAGRMAMPFLTAYSGAKFGLEGISEGLHYEVRPLGVDVAIVEPGAFPTDIGSKMAVGSDQSVNEGYGDILKIPEAIGAGLAQLFETVKPNPQEVADAIIKLINLPKGQRPLRTVVDPATGHFVKATNEAALAQSNPMLEAFGMADLLK